MKTDIEIRDDMYAFIKGSRLHRAVSGKLCNKPMRPANSCKEDICIDVVTNENLRRKQVATVFVRIYVADIDEKGQMSENTPRLRELARIAEETLRSGNGGEFRFDLDVVKTYEADGIHAHYISCKISYFQSNN